MKAYIALEQLEKAKAAFAEMRREKGANTMAYAIMVDAYGKQNEKLNEPAIEEIEALFQEGSKIKLADEEDSYEPLYASIIYIYSRRQDAKRAEDLFTELETRHVPSQVTFGVIINMFSRYLLQFRFSVLIAIG